MSSGCEYYRVQIFMFEILRAQRERLLLDRDRMNNLSPNDTMLSIWNTVLSFL